MKKLFLFLSIVFFISCGSSESEDESANGSQSDFPSFVDSNNLRIFARKGVSESFLKNVGKVYDEMFQEIADPAMRNVFLSTSKSKYVYQRVGVDGMSPEGNPSKPYGDNATDYIWEMKSGGADQIGEVIEHLLHTVTAVVLYLSHGDWDYKSSSSPLYLAMKEASDKGIYDLSSYDNLKGDEAYNRIITQEYAYWLILAEWNYYVVTGKKEAGMTGNGEFTLGTPLEIQSNLPLGHNLYKNYIEKILTIPDKNKIIALFP
tara:strand:+ start:1472 stop:2254 length:783 start_codon:yes stop_codon:yes gene_type:complete